MERAVNIVLVEPEIPPNTGNVGRTCIGVGATLHLVGPLGFSLEDKDLKRAGLDYWHKINLVRHADWETFLSTIPSGADLHFFSTHGAVSFWDVSYRAPCYLIFGSESRGFPAPFYERYRERLVRIPVSDDIRSLNLSTAVGVATFEVARQLNLRVDRGEITPVYPEELNKALGSITQI